MYKLFLEVTTELESKFLKKQAEDPSAFLGKIVFVEGESENYIMVNGKKYGSVAVKHYDSEVSVTTPEALTAAISSISPDSKTNITIIGDITPESKISIPAGANATITLSGANLDFTGIANKYGIEIAKGSTLTVTGTGSINAGSNKRVFINSGNLIIEGGDYNAQIVVANTDGATTTIKDGTFRAQEQSLLVACKNSTLNIEGGTFTALDNAIVSDNGNTGLTGNTINITGGKFYGETITPGYIGCGVYVANDTTVTINNAEFNIANGCGILARAGHVTIDNTTISCTGTSTTGKVGDSSAIVECVPFVFDEVSKYPGLTDDSSIVIRTVRLSGECIDSATSAITKFCILTGDNKTNAIHLHNDDATATSRIEIK